MGPFSMNDFTAHRDKGDTHSLKTPSAFKDSLFTNLEICLNYAQKFLLPRLLVIRFISRLPKFEMSEKARLSGVSPAPFPPLPSVGDVTNPTSDC